MEKLIVLVSLLAALAFFVGLIKPKWVKMPSRVGSSVIYGIIFICATTLGSALYPSQKVSVTVKDAPVEQKPQEQEPVKFELAGMSLEDYRRAVKDKRHEIVADYIKFKGIPDSDADGFYACLSEYSFTKAGDLALGDVLGWCDADYSNDMKSLAKKINFDAFQGNFSRWDGSYRPLERLIKQSMNDDSSYKHVSTTYRLLPGEIPQAVVETTFRGTNAYGAVVKQVVAARVNILTGDVVEIVEN